MEECYICLEKETKENNFLDKNICKCKSLRLHENCFKKLENIYNCSICKEYFENLHLKYDNYILNIKKGGFREIYNVDNEGNKHGYYKCYYPNGDIYISCFFINGLRFGMYQIYYQNFILKESCWYELGCKDGTYLSYYPNGKLYKKIKYINDKIHGSYEIFDIKGYHIVKTFGYKGLVHGKLNIYYENKYQHLEARYKKGLLNGRVRSWKEDGTLQFDDIYKNGKYIKKYIPKEKFIISFCSKIINCFMRKKRIFTTQ